MTLLEEDLEEAKRAAGDPPGSPNPRKPSPELDHHLSQQVKSLRLFFQFMQQQVTQNLEMFRTQLELSDLIRARAEQIAAVVESQREAGTIDTTHTPSQDDGETETDPFEVCIRSTKAFFPLIAWMRAGDHGIISLPLSLWYVDSGRQILSHAADLAIYVQRKRKLEEDQQKAMQDLQEQILQHAEGRMSPFLPSVASPEAGGSPVSPSEESLVSALRYVTRGKRKKKTVPPGVVSTASLI